MPFTISTSPSFIESFDAAACILTGYTLTVGNSCQGKISSSTDVDYYRVHLVAGQTYTIAAMGTGTDYLHDTYLQLRNSCGLSLVINDDGGPGFNSLITYTCSTTGYYYLDVRGDPGSNLTGQYGLSFTSGNHASFDLSMAAASFFSCNCPTWSTIGTPATVTYGFRESGPAYDALDNLSTFSQLSTIEIAAIRTILGVWSAVCNITFQEVNQGGYTNNATILFGNYYSNSDGAIAYAYVPGEQNYSNSNPFGYGAANTSPTADDGDVWLNTDSVSTTSLPIGSLSFFAIMHEIGHALGLSHPGDYNGSDPFTYNNFAQFIQDTEMYTVMSYFDGFETGQSPGSFATAYTPMIADIYEMQLLYGINTTTRTGNTTYGFSDNTGSPIYSFTTGVIPLLCIWDAGGIDTLNCSGFTQHQTIDLNAGSFSNVGSGINNVSIAFGAIIENATGGAGNDIIIGNSLNNELTGNGGNDTLTGGSGVDTFFINEGTDTITDLAAGNIADNLIVFSGATATATATGNFTATRSTVNNGTASINTNGHNVSFALAGGAHGWTITNSSATGVTLIGSAHNDTIIGGWGNDIVKGGMGIDKFVFNTTPNAWTNHDTVTDFVHALDILQFSKAVFTTISSWTETAFWSGAWAVAGDDSTDRIVYNTTTGNLYYDADGSGAGSSILVATIGITTHPTLDWYDIQLVA